jgi:hypothetical protein
MRNWWIFILFFIKGLLFSQYNPSWFSRINKGWCESRVKVIDRRPTDNCNYSGQYDVWYPVVIENFNFKEDTPNEWMFNRDGWIDDELLVSCGGGSYYGPGLFAYNNGNFDVSNGIAYLKVKKEWIPEGQNSSCPDKPYHFTNSVLYSEFNIKQGYVVAKIKLPNNIYMWPAFWLQKKYPTSGYSEIDVFEFYDHNFTNTPSGNCDAYNDMRMTIHGMYGGITCKRGRKFPVPGGSNFFKYFHYYSVFLSDYQCLITLDNSIKGIATKFYEGPYVPITLSSCHYGADAGVPSYIYSCNQMQNLQGCNVNIFGNCVVYNKVDEDLAFPNPSSMTYQVRFSNWLTNNWYDGLKSYLVNKLESEWNNFSDEDKQIAIDNVVVYQPIKCYKNQVINSFNDFVNETRHTNFLSGSKISLSNYHITPSMVWPTYLLGTDEIEIKPNVNDVAFEEGALLRAEIISCSGSSVSQRTTNNSNDTLPPVLPIDYFDKQDSFYVALQNYYNSPLVSETDNGSLQIFPNPTSDHFHISMAEEDFNDLKKIEIVNTLGQVKELPIRESQDISDLAEGIYMVKFYFSTGMLVVKSLIIKR